MSHPTICLPASYLDLATEDDSFVFEFHKGMNGFFMDAEDILRLKSNYVEQNLPSESHNLEPLPAFSVEIHTRILKDMVSELPKPINPELEFHFVLHKERIDVYLDNVKQDGEIFPTYDFANSEDENKFAVAMDKAKFFTLNANLTEAPECDDEDVCEYCGNTESDCTCEESEPEEDDRCGECGRSLATCTCCEEDEDEDDDDDDGFEIDDDTIMQHLAALTDPDYYKKHAEKIFSDVIVEENPIEKPITLTVHRIIWDTVDAALQRITEEQNIPYYHAVQEMEEHFKKELGYNDAPEGTAVGIILDISNIAPRLKELAKTDPENAVHWYDAAEGLVNLKRGLHAILPNIEPEDVWRLESADLRKLHDMFLTVTHVSKESIELSTLRTFYERLFD